MSEEQITGAEEQARSNGWLPKKEYAGDPEKWVTAEEFNKNGEYIGTIIREQKKNKRLEKELEQVKEAVRNLGEHNKKVAEHAKEEAIKELKQIKKEALKEGDADTVVEVDDKLLEISQTEPEKDILPEPTGPDPEVVSWAENNPEIADNPILSKAFEAMVITMVNEQPELRNDPAKALEEATIAFKQEFPDKFESSTRKTKQSVLSRTSTKSTSSKQNKFTSNNLSQEQRRLAQQMIDSGAPITLDEYAQQLGDMGEL